MNAPLIASLAAAGLAAGWIQRALIVRLAAPADQPDSPDTPPLAAGPPPLAAGPPPLGAGPPLDRSGAGRAARPPALAVGCATAILLGALAARVHPGLVLAAACWLAAYAVPLAFVDAAVRRLPDRLTVPAYAGTAALLLLAAAVTGPWSALQRAALGGLALAGFYLLLLLISPSGMGLGDVKLAASLGTLLAWFGWRVLIAGGFAGFLLAAVYAQLLLVAGRAGRKQHIPFGPFMIAGAVLAVLAWPV